MKHGSKYWLNLPLKVIFQGQLISKWICFHEFITFRLLAGLLLSSFKVSPSEWMKNEITQLLTNWRKKSKTKKPKQHQQKSRPGKQNSSCFEAAFHGGKSQTRAPNWKRIKFGWGQNAFPHPYLATDHLGKEAGWADLQYLLLGKGKPSLILILCLLKYAWPYLRSVADKWRDRYGSRATKHSCYLLMK